MALGRLEVERHYVDIAVADRAERRDVLLLQDRKRLPHARGRGSERPVRRNVVVLRAWIGGPALLGALEQHFAYPHEDMWLAAHFFIGVIEAGTVIGIAAEH